MVRDEQVVGDEGLATVGDGRGHRSLAVLCVAGLQVAASQAAVGSIHDWPAGSDYDYSGPTGRAHGPQPFGAYR